MAIYSGFTHWKWWFSMAMLVYQRVVLPELFLSTPKGVFGRCFPWFCPPNGCDLRCSEICCSHGSKMNELAPFGSLLTVPTTLRVFKPCVVEKAKAEPFPAHVSIIVGKGQLTSFIYASLSSLFAKLSYVPPLVSGVRHVLENWTNYDPYRESRQTPREAFRHCSV